MLERIRGGGRALRVHAEPVDGGVDAGEAAVVPHDVLYTEPGSSGRRRVPVRLFFTGRKSGPSRSSLCPACAR